MKLGQVKTAFVNLLIISLPMLTIMILLLEVFFRIVIPASSLPFVSYDKGEDILRYDINGPRQGQATFGNFAQQRAHWRINNEGWNSHRDYKFFSEAKRKPRIAIIGDSYVEAFTVDFDSSIGANLERLCDNRLEAYDFGISGAPLSQYLHMSRYVTRNFSPDIIVFVVIHNDFDESLRKINPKTYFMQINIENGEVNESYPKPYHPNKLRRLVGKSAIVRALNYNFKLSRERFKANQREHNFNANIDVKAALAVRVETAIAVNYVVKQSVHENIGTPIVYMIDAPRDDIYHGRDSSSVQWMNDLLGEACERHNAFFLDLTGTFKRKFRKTGIKFNSTYDSHWDGVGHKAAADELFEFLNRNSLIPEYEN